MSRFAGPVQDLLVAYHLLGRYKHQNEASVLDTRYQSASVTVGIAAHTSVGRAVQDLIDRVEASIGRVVSVGARVESRGGGGGGGGGGHNGSGHNGGGGGSGLGGDSKQAPPPPMPPRRESTPPPPPPPPPPPMVSGLGSGSSLDAEQRPPGGNHRAHDHAHTRRLHVSLCAIVPPHTTAVQLLDVLSNMRLGV